MTPYSALSPWAPSIKLMSGQTVRYATPSWSWSVSPPPPDASSCAVAPCCPGPPCHWPARFRPRRQHGAGAEPRVHARGLGGGRLSLAVSGRHRPQDPTSPTELAGWLLQLYEPLRAPFVMTDLTSAEAIKVASNVFLAAKITYANERASLCAAAGADAQAVVDGMGLDRRIGRAFLSPGPGFGGSCFPSQSHAARSRGEARDTNAADGRHRCFE